MEKTYVSAARPSGEKPSGLDLPMWNGGLLYTDNPHFPSMLALWKKNGYVVEYKTEVG